MDVDHARTFLTIIETGTFRQAAARLNLTQSAISARMRALEATVGKRLLERSKSGIRLTPAGEQFHRHAVTLVRVWRQALLEVALPEDQAEHLAVGAQISLWEGFLLAWLSQLRSERADLAVTASSGDSQQLMAQLEDGTVDLVVVYRAVQRPGVIVEHIFDEELVLVTSQHGDTDTNNKHGLSENYVFVNWGPEFAADHAETYASQYATAIKLDLGAVGINYLFENRASGYFPLRIARPYIADGRLHLARGMRRFVYPVYVAYPELNDPSRLNALTASLRRIAAEIEG